MNTVPASDICGANTYMRGKYLILYRGRFDPLRVQGGPHIPPPRLPEEQQKIRLLDIAE